MGYMEMKSNIIGGSNVYPCKESPFCDQEFVNQIEDYEVLKRIHKKQEIRQTSVHLTEKQSQIMEIEMRCYYAKNDPCWGYVNGQGIQCKCIKGRCPQIKKCNPTYTSEQEDYWKMTDEAKVLYGHPDKQKKYYYVDLVSDKEMSRYYSDPKGAGIEFPPMPDPEIPEQQNGRKLVIIGSDSTYFGDADDQWSPIWGYVDEPEDGGLVTSQYGRSKETVFVNSHKVGEKPKKEAVKQKEPANEKAQVVDKPKKSVPAKSEESKKLQYEKQVKDKIGTSYQLVEITEELIKELSHGKILNIILSNEAEMAYVSGMFLRNQIAHDIELCDGKELVCLWKAQSKEINLSSGIFLISRAFIKQGYSLEIEAVWSGLKNANRVNEIVVSGRDFFGFTGKDEQQRWGCKNLYNATHLVIQNDDLFLSLPVEEDQPISLIKNEKNYIILSVKNEKQLGITTESLWSALDNLKKSGDISEFPELISGLVLTKSSSGFEIKGIGHLKFDEY